MSKLKGSLRSFISSNVMGHGGLKPVAEMNLKTRGTTPLSQNLFHDVSIDLIEGTNKQVWLDLKSGWCHLCQEPIGGSMGVHIGDRDHTNLQYFLLLFAAYPRTWRPADVFKAAALRHSSIFGYATTHSSSDHLHVVDDAVRRSELEGLLLHMTEAPHLALRSLRGEVPLGFWYSGERMWKKRMTRMVNQMLPAANAGMTTNLTQKCWGRTNFDRMYDAMQIQRVVRSYGSEPYTDKESKAFFMRLVTWELMSVEARRDLCEVTKQLAELAMRRLCFELIFLQSMEYMNRVQRVHELLERPSLEELQRMNIM